MKRLLLVDFENVQKVSLAELPEDVHVQFVLGAKQKSLPTNLAVQAQPLGARFKHVLIQDMAPNAVDFCIAFYLGEVLTQHPRAECVILSRDKKGFDPLVKHLTKDRGLAVRRVNTQKEAFPTVPKKGSPDPFMKLLGLLGKEKVLPKKRKGLEGKIRSWYSRASDSERNALVQRLLDEEHVKDNNGAMTYSVRIAG
jgi:hypothetical protein